MKVKFELRSIAIAVMVQALFLNPSAGQDKATGGGHVSVIQLELQRRLDRGKLDGCEITYLIGFQDNIYRQGGITALRGSLALMGFVGNNDKAPAVLLKVAAFDMRNNSPVPAPLQMAYLSIRGNIYAGKEFVNFDCENGGMCVGYNALEHSELITEVADGFEINISRMGGRSDVRVPVSIPPAIDGAADQYTKCAADLLEALENKLIR